MIFLMPTRKTLNIVECDDSDPHPISCDAGYLTRLMAICNRFYMFQSTCPLSPATLTPVIHQLGPRVLFYTLHLHDAKYSIIRSQFV